MTTLNISGLVVTFPDGATGIVRQAAVTRHDSAHIGIAALTIERSDSSVAGELWLTPETFKEIEGHHQEMLSEVVGQALGDVVQRKGLQDGFRVRVSFHAGLAGVDSIEITDDPR